MSQQNNPGLSQGQQPRVQIGLNQIQQLARQCTAEINKAKEVGVDTPEGKQHLLKAQRIKSILLQYQEQQQQAANANANTTTNNTTAGNNMSALNGQQVSNNGSPQIQQQQFTQQTVTPMQQQQQSPINHTQQIQQPRPISQNNSPVIGNNGANRGATASPNTMTQTGSPSTQQPKTPIQQLQQLKIILNEYNKKLKIIEEAKKSNTLPPDSLAKMEQQEQTLRERFQSYRNAAYSLTQQLSKQNPNIQPQAANRIANPVSVGGTPHVAAAQTMSQVPPGNNFQLPNGQNQTNQIQSMNNSQNKNFQFQQTGMIPQSNPPFNQLSNSAPNQQIGQHPLSKPQSPAVSAPNFQQLPNNQSQQSPPLQRKAIPSQQQNTGSRIGTPQPNSEFSNSNLNRVGTSASPNTPVTNVNAAARPSDATAGASNGSANIYKSSVSSINIPAQLNVKPPSAITATQNRPSLTGGNGFASPALTTPALLKLPPFEMQSDRVLSKRKLSELVKTVGADEGDGQTVIDGDVEELLLDLADEFVTNVTGFACRLAKHRKSENLEAKDLQLHLEKNWNIRVPGFSSDEIRSVRKWPANTAHTQRVQGIGISKSVDQNK